MKQGLAEAGRTGGAAECCLCLALFIGADDQPLACAVPSANLYPTIRMDHQGGKAKRQQHSMADHAQSEQQKQGVELSIELE